MRWLIERNRSGQVYCRHAGNQQQQYGATSQDDTCPKRTLRPHPSIRRAIVLVDFVTVSHSSLLEVAIHAPTSVASNIANAMANGHTTGVVRVRSLTVVVMRHCFDDLAETESAKVCEAFTATYVH